MIKNMAGLMKQAQEMQERMAHMQEQLEKSEVSGSSGAGLVQVTLSGKGDLKSLKIDPSLLVPHEQEVLEDLILAAFRDAKSRLDHQTQEEMSKVTGGIAGLKLPFL